MPLGPVDSDGVTFDVANTISIWVELLIYGIYVTLFISALTVILKKKAINTAGSAWSTWIFLLAIILMFGVATLHLAIGLYRFLRGHRIGANPSSSFFYYFDSSKWENVASNTMMGVMFWLGDALVIYRCYYVWNRNFWVVIIPILLFFATVGINAFALYWFVHPSDIHLEVHIVISILNAIFPLALLQNIMTTGLIAAKIWLQHKASSASGVANGGSRLSLMRILLIVVESAMIYTLQLLILIILYFRPSNVQFIVQSAIVPSIGIVFVLIAVRVHVAKSQSTFGTGLGTLPAWLADETSDNEMDDQQSQAQVTGVTFRVAANDPDPYYDPSEPLGSSSYTHKSHTNDKLLHVV